MLFWLPTSEKFGSEKPLGTVRYYSNFEDATSSRPSTATETPPMNQLGWVTAGAGDGVGVGVGFCVVVCANAESAAAMRPQANIRESVIRFMAYLTNAQPEGEFEPCSAKWQFGQDRSIWRELRVV